jgi:hypothetical protein
MTENWGEEKLDTHGALTEFGPLHCRKTARKQTSDGTACFANFMTQPTKSEILVANKEYDGELEKLVNALVGQDRNQAHPGPNGFPWDNPNIPSGYTYLAQLVAHDVVFTALSSARLNDQCDRFQNHRSSALNLDTLFGAHPSVARHAYEPEDSTDLFRNRLSLGQMQFSSRHPKAPPLTPADHDANADKDGECKAKEKTVVKGPKRDIGRAKRSDDAHLTEVCLADSRNDNNAILSQLTALFSHLHNGIVGKLEDHYRECERKFTSRAQRVETMYLEARNLVTHVYLDVIQHDLLERMLSPEVYKFYSRKKVGFLHRKHNLIPLEFSHAVFRCGHSMVRPSYFMGKRFGNSRLQAETLSFNSAFKASHMPFDETWIIDWADFFEMGSDRPRNLSGKFEPAFSNFMTPGPLENHKNSSLPLDDLRRSTRSGLWSVDGLLRKVGEKRKTLFHKSTFYQGDITAYKKPMQIWLEDLQDKPNPEIADSPPLSLFVLFEAQQEHDGLRLGTLGSIIIADVLFAAIKARRQEMDLVRNEKLKQAFFPKEHLQDMPSLIRSTEQFVDDLDGQLPLFSKS